MCSCFPAGNNVVTVIIFSFISAYWKPFITNNSERRGLSSQIFPSAADLAVWSVRADRGWSIAVLPFLGSCWTPPSCAAQGRTHTGCTDQAAHQPPATDLLLPQVNLKLQTPLQCGRVLCHSLTSLPHPDETALSPAGFTLVQESASTAFWTHFCKGIKTEIQYIYCKLQIRA